MQLSFNSAQAQTAKVQVGFRDLIQESEYI